MVGVDEVGRGAWAGPLLVVAARKTKSLPVDLKDSKLLSRAQREGFFDLLLDSCEFGEGWVTSKEIDKMGLADALRVGVDRSLKALDAAFDEEIIMDGKTNYISSHYINVKCIIGADVMIPLVSAASVYAKVLRDRYMTKLARKHTNYGFDCHVGYGTARHSRALNEHGILSGVHRVTYAPIKKIAEIDR